jgi:hypothetical protein
MSDLFSLAAALLLAAVLAFGHWVHLAGGRGRRDAVSAAAGISVAYVFIDVLPELGARQQAFLATIAGRAVLFPQFRGYLAALAGFVAFYGLEKMVLATRTDALDLGHQHGESLRIFRVQITGFAAYSALIGYLLVERAEKGPLSLGLYTFAMALHFFVTDHSLAREHGARYLTTGRWVLAAAVLIGWTVGVLVPLPVGVMVVLFGFIAGGVVINSVKGELPEEGEGRFWPFLAGAAGYALLLMLA